MSTSIDVVVSRDDLVVVSGRAEGRGGAAIIFNSKNGSHVGVHLFEGAMYELFNQLRAHIERHGERPTGENVVRLT